MKIVEQVLLVGLFLFFFSNNANSSQIDIKRINQKDGLSHNWVRCIYQDNVGYIWFGTSGALNRYDGYKCKVYNIGNGSVNSILQKDTNELWICSDLGVYTFNIVTEKLKLCNQLGYKSIFCVMKDNDQCFWFGSNLGYFKYYPKEDRVENVFISQNPLDLKTNYINTIYKDTKGNVWFGTKNGLHVLKYKSKIYTPYLLNYNHNTFAINEVYSIKEDDSHKLWIGSLQGGLECLPNAINTPDKLSITNVAQGSVMDILIDKQKTLWFASGNGLGTLNLKNFTTDKKPSIYYYKNDINNPKSVSENSIFSLFKDNMNDLWVGTMGSGVNLISLRGKQFNVISKTLGLTNTLISNLVNCIFEEEKYLWIGTESGLDRYDKQTKTYKHFTHNNDNPSSLKSNSIFSLKKDSQGKLWVGTWAGGINVYDYKTESFSHFYPDGGKYSLNNENIFAIDEDHYNNMWIGTIGGGVNRYNRKSNTFTHYKFDFKNPQSIRTNYINSILVTHDGHVFIADFHFLEEYNEKKDGFDSYIIKDTSLQNMPYNYITSLFEDSKHHLWLSTCDGLQYFDRKTKTFTTFLKTKSSVNNSIVGIEEDGKGNLWLSTNNGIIKFINGITLPINPDYQRFTKTDGIAGDECKRRSMYKNNDGILYVGSSLGFTYFNPDSIILNAHIPTIAISELKVLSALPNENATYKSFDINPNAVKSVTLSYKNSNFVIDFAALNFLSSENNQYKYMLEGYDSDWIDVGGQTSATYTNIQAGNYRFNIKASNNDGIWTLQPKCLSIIITPPWWNTILFKLFCIIVIILAIYFFFRIRLSLLQKQKNVLEKTVEEKTFELKNSNEELTCQRDEIFQQATFIKSANQELKKLSVVASQTNNSVILLDKNGKIEWVNYGFSKMLDISQTDIDKILDRTIFDFFKDFICNNHCCVENITFDKDTKKCHVLNKMHYALLHQVSVNYEYIYRTKAGKIIEIQTTLNPIVDENDEIIQFVAIETDITEIQEQKHQIEDVNKVMTDSIVYASRIQSALLPAPEDLKNFFKEYFVIYKPKNVVSGDFFWATKIDENIVFCVADCTGHGVPGAFMSMLGISFLRETVEIERNIKPSEILNKLRQKVIKALNQNNNFGGSKDGMDISLFSLNTITNELQYANANNASIVIGSENKKATILYKDKMPIGIHEKIVPFTNNIIQLKSGDLLYLFSDGYSDQFGGPNTKKFMSSQFNKMLFDIHQKPIHEQKEIVTDRFENWKNYLSLNNEQTDDVTVIGIKIS
jgi:ligand-binding sensor domain-containing protein/serine phosphatase RsbU (regulator of sigma subunit)